MAASEHSKSADDLIVTQRAALCLDFANTLAYRGSSPQESLQTLADLLKWCADARSVPSGVSHQMRGWLDKHPKRAADIFSEAIALREVIYRVFHSVASSANPDDGDLSLLNRALRDTPPRTAVKRSAEGFGWEVEESKPSAGLLLAPVLWSAGDLLVGSELGRLRECSNDKCLWLFLDDSKNGTRRWCSMQSCGNRAKAHRHYLRQKQS
jgi:predicted RNA-binding Zn ribbon-like protein